MTDQPCDLAADPVETIKAQWHDKLDALENAIREGWMRADDYTLDRVAVRTLLRAIEQRDKTIADFHLGEIIAVDSAVEIARLNARIRELEQPRPAAGVDEEVAEIYARMDVGNGLFSDLQRLRVALDRSAQECAWLQAHKDRLEAKERSIIEMIDRIAAKDMEIRQLNESLELRLKGDRK